MLIEFSVENFRSIKNEARLSLVAGPGKEHRDSNVMIPELNQRVRATPLLRSAAIYGANAAGKSNLIRALYTMQQIVRQSGREIGELPVAPFRFSPESVDRPTTFELVGVVNRMRFQYGFSATAGAVTDEWLYAWPLGRIQFWFKRTTDAESGEAKCKFGNKLAGDKEVWRRATRSNALLLSTAITLNSEQLRPIFDWFSKNLHVGGSGGWRGGFSAQWCEGDRKDEVVQFLRAADFGIDGLRMVKKEFTPDMLPSDMPAGLTNRMKEESPGTGLVEIRLSHKTEHGQPVELALSEESDGTQKVFELAAPWIDTFDNGHVLVLDDLHEHLHSSLVRFLVNRFHDPAANANGAQLIFSTHDTSMLNQDIFRRDQIWFCERNARLETSVFPLTNFRPRRGVENLERLYLGGRYGAVPVPRILAAITGD